MNAMFKGIDVRVDQLDHTHINRRIKFRRPASNSYAAPVVSGVLLAVSPTSVVRGNVRKSAYTLSLGFPSREGGMNQDKFGPLLATSSVEIGPLFTARPSRYLREMRAQEDEEWELEVSRYRAEAPDWLPDALVYEYGHSLAQAKDAFILETFGNGFDATSSAGDHIIRTKPRRPEADGNQATIITDIFLLTKAQNALCDAWGEPHAERAIARTAHEFTCRRQYLKI